MYDLSSFVFVLMVSICFIYLCHYDYRGGQSNFECSTLFSPKNDNPPPIKLTQSTHKNCQHVLIRECPWRLVMPLTQRGGQPILLWRRHLRWLGQRPSGLRQRLHHTSLSPHPPKWIPLPLHKPPRLPMDRPLPSPVVWRLLSMLRIL